MTTPESLPARRKRAPRHEATDSRAEGISASVRTIASIGCGAMHRIRVARLSGGRRYIAVLKLFIQGSFFGVTAGVSTLVELSPKP